jgi:hypothetical protein
MSTLERTSMRGRAHMSMTHNKGLEHEGGVYKTRSKTSPAQGMPSMRLYNPCQIVIILCVPAHIQDPH